MFGIGVTEIIIIAIIVLVVFGAGRLPEVMTGLGKGIKDFKSAVTGDDDDDTSKS